jgi:hypothetical protein
MDGGKFGSMINENLHDLYQVKSKREISSTYRRSASRWQKKDKADFITMDVS